ncbi:MAG: hypothetical protein PHD37_07870 [Gallionellaceae bacterium]|nr:hypothetical protein [Gallionellaceae bacterium]
MTGKTFWTAAPLLIIALAAGVLWKGGGEPPVATVTLSCADLVAGCATRLRGRDISLGLSGVVKPLKPFQVWVKAAGAGKVQARFVMQGMDMGFNYYTLRAEGDDLFRARVTLPICVSGRRDWIMAVEIDGATIQVPFTSEA